MPENHNKNLKDFIISLNLKKNPVEELRYDQNDGELSIYITPKDRSLAIEDFKFSHDGEQTDLESIKILGSLMARLHFNKTNNLFWSAILAKDEIKGAIDFKDLIEELKNHVPGIKTLIIFNETGNSFAWAENKIRLQNLARTKSGSFFNNHLEFSIAADNFKNEIGRIIALF